MPQIVPSFCRHCEAVCPILVTIVDGRPVKVTGDPDAIEYEGYTCPKGRATADAHNDPHRLLRSLRRGPDGKFEIINSLKAVEEITEKTQRIIEKHGPNSIAMYFGGGSPSEFFNVMMGHMFFRALGSSMTFTASTIDKPAERIALALHGNWGAGAHPFTGSDTWIIVGANPVIAKSNGVPMRNPGMRLKDATKGGMKLIVIDPRRTETARRANIHLQARAGEDPSILAGLINVIIAEDLHDKVFLADNAVGFETLKAATSRFTPEYVAERAGVPTDMLIEAARAFGSGRRGTVVCSTGPSFSTRSNLTFYLALCLNTLCGRWVRAGENVPQPNVLLPAYTPRAQPQAPYPVFGSRQFASGMRENASGMPTTALPDEMLIDGEGRIRALFSVGGNPMSSWPNHRKTEAGLKNLDLLVQFDVVMSATAGVADYVLASPMSLEVPATTYYAEALKYLNITRGMDIPWAQYAPAVVAPPPGSDLIHGHEVFFRMAQKMGIALDWVNYHGTGKFIESPAQIIPLDMTRIPTMDELCQIITYNSRIPLEEVKKYPHGHKFDEPVLVAPRSPDCNDLLQIADPMMMAELEEVRTEGYRSQQSDQAFPYRLLSRRTNNFMNSNLIGLPVLTRNKHHNPVSMHPLDMADLGLSDGDIVKIRSRAGSLLSSVESDESLRPGYVSMTHGFGGHGRDMESDPYAGANVNLLVSTDEVDPISGIPRMSNIPVSIERGFGALCQESVEAKSQSMIGA